MKTKILIAIFLILSTNAWAEERYAEKVKWFSLKEGKERAMAEKKPMLVDFAVAKGCPRCDFLQKNVYSKDEIVKKINSDFVPIFIDLSKKLSPEEKVLGEKYDFKNDCLLLFLDYNGNVIKEPEAGQMCFADKIEPEVFIKYLDGVKNRMFKK
ncbi:MAG: thioredoxin family protein [Nitrospiraceae bacterium]|nr:MAG: thioredoxin family protein [Nitrospiraceae bacterium]